MLKRRKKLIEHLIYSDKGITGAVLSKRLSVSVRTIRNDISALNKVFQKLHASIKSDKTKGYYIAKEDKQVFLREIGRILDDTAYVLPSTPSERLVFIALKLLYDNLYITLEALSEILFVSKTTVHNDVKKLLEIGKNCNNIKIELEVSSLKGIYLKGAESQKRLFVFQIMRQFYSHNFNGFKNILKLFDMNFDNSFFVIYNAYVLHLDAHNIALTDRDLNILVLEAAISCSRIVKGYTVEVDYKNISETSIKTVADEISKMNDIVLSHQERLFFGDCFSLSRVLVIDSDHSDMIRGDAKNIVDQFFRDIYMQYQINLSVTDLFIRNFTIHISSMINRIKLRSYDDFSMAKEIKAAYPFSFELATNIMPIIKEETGVIINETELAYIAVYLAVAFEQIKSKKNAAVICGSGLGTAQLVIKRLEMFFHNEINIIGYYPIYQIEKILEEKSSEIDILLSTIPVTIETNIPMINISPLFTQEDINKLNVFLKDNHTSKIKNIESPLLYSVLDKNLFKVYEHNADDEDILNDLTDLLVKSNYIDNKEKFIKSVIQRENMYSTVYGKIWLPHPMETMSKETKAVVAVINGCEKQLIVFLLAVNSKEYEKFQFLYDKIINLTDSQKIIEDILNIKKFDEFISLIEVL